MLHLIQVLLTLQQHGCVMFSAPTRHVTNVRPSPNSPHQAVISHQTPEYQCLWFQIYRASNFYCMAIAAGPSSPSGPPSATDWAAVSIAAASETRVTAATVVASTAIAVAVTNDDVAAAAADNEDNDNDDVWIHPLPPSQQQLSVATRSRQQEPHRGKLPCCLSFQMLQRYLCVHILKDLIGL